MGDPTERGYEDSEGAASTVQSTKVLSRPYVEKTLKKSNQLTSKAGSWTQRGKKTNKQTKETKQHSKPDVYPRAKHSQPRLS